MINQVNVLIYKKQAKNKLKHYFKELFYSTIFFRITTKKIN